MNVLIQSSPNLNSHEKYKTQHKYADLWQLCLSLKSLHIFHHVFFIKAYLCLLRAFQLLFGKHSLIWICLKASVSACSVSVAHIPQFSRLENSTGKHPSALQTKSLPSYFPRLPAVVLQSFVVDSHALRKCQGNLFCCSQLHAQNSNTYLPAMSYLIRDSCFLLGNPAHQFPFSFLLV